MLAYPLPTLYGLSLQCPAMPGWWSSQCHLRCSTHMRQCCSWVAGPRVPLGLQAAPLGSLMQAARLGCACRSVLSGLSGFSLRRGGRHTLQEGLLMQPPCCRGQWRPCSTGAAQAEDAAAGVTFQPCNDHNTPRDGHWPGKKITSMCRETYATCNSSCNSGVALCFGCLTLLRSLQGCPHYCRYLEMIDSLPLQVSLDQKLKQSARYLVSNLFMQPGCKQWWSICETSGTCLPLRYNVEVRVQPKSCLQYRSPLQHLSIVCCPWCSVVNPPACLHSVRLSQ